MRPAPHVHVEWVDDEAVVLDPDRQELHYLNASAALAFALITEHGYDPGIAELRSRYGETPDFDAQLEHLVKELVDKGLLIA